ncbi:hypothetical protein PCA31118_01826 [Pandoraea captiosa]|jgi:hypothetical protein|uniref:DUF2474 domain-containing protein n=1 Tax=Pandoraea captiosa TaxID=2508302 RepID=A0A5E4ZU78_9BURK|nr:hypothetical protein PCA31118_01826 [Pandoraea captiosa]
MRHADDIHERTRRRRRQALWFVALWCAGVALTAAVTLPLHLLVVWAR